MLARAASAGLNLRPTLRPATIGDVPAFLELFRATYGRSLTGAEVAWQYFHEDARGTLLLAELAGRLVGCHGSQEVVAASQQGPSSFLFNTHSIVAPDQRGTDLYQRMLEARRARNTFCVANQNAMPVLTRLHRWQCLATLPTMAADVDRLGLISRDGVRFCRRHRFDENDASLLRQLCEETGRTVVGSDAPWLNWRFVARPGHDYEIHQVCDHDRLVGHVALKTYDDPETGVRCGDLVQFVLLESSADLLGAVLSHCAVRCAALGATTLQCWLPEEQASKLGFVQTSPTRFLCYDGAAQAPEFWIQMSLSEVY